MSKERLQNNNSRIDTYKETFKNLPTYLAPVDLEVTAGVEDVTKTPESGKSFGNVLVHPTPSEVKEVTAGVEDLSVTPSEGMLLSEVVVSPTPTQSKTVTPTKEEQTILPDTGFHLESVVVEPQSGGGEGVNCWGKYVPPYVDEGSYSQVDVTGSSGMTGEVGIYYADSYTVNLETKIFTLTNPTYISCMYYYTQSGNASYSPSRLAGKYFIPNPTGDSGSVGAKSGTEIYYGNPSAINASVRQDSSANTSYRTICSAKKLTVADKEFVSYVVSDDASEYPNGETHTDGYRYDLIS